MKRSVWFAVLLVLAAASARAEAPAEFRGHGGPVKAIAALADGTTLVTGGFDSALIVWDIQSGAAKRVLRFHGSTVNALVALPGDCFASGGEDGKIAVWCGPEAEPKQVYQGHTAPVTQLAVSRDGQFLASVSFDRTVRLWPLIKGEARVFEAAAAPLSAVAFLADASGIVTGGYDGLVRIIPLQGQPAPRPLSLSVPVNAVTVSPDGSLVIAGADGHLRRLSAQLSIQSDIDIGSGPLTTVAVTPDGTKIATAGMRTQVTLIDAATGKTSFEILGPGLPVWSLAFSNDGRELFTGGQDRAVRRWVSATGKPSGNELKEEAAATLPYPHERGAELFGACLACHGLTPDDTAKAGPTLAGIFGRRIATAPGYNYSQALKNLDIVWSAETIGKLFTLGPAAYTPGTKMPEQTLSDPTDRDAFITWLQKATSR